MERSHMSGKNVLIISANAATAVSALDPKNVLTITDESVVADLHKLVRERKELGIRLTRKLRDQGLDLAEEEETEEQTTEEA
jgi:hypothetical protein